MQIQLKRIYDPVAPDDGFRVLADRLWPRGVSKDSAHIDLWAKDITPTAQLRQSFHSGQCSWQQFADGYRAELSTNSHLDAFVEEISKQPAVTLLSSVKDINHSHLTVLLDVLNGVMR